jgi:hypothetical protein
MNPEAQVQIGCFELDLAKFVDGETKEVELAMADYEGASLKIKIKGVIQEKGPAKRLTDNVDVLVSQDEEQKSNLKRLQHSHIKQLSLKQAEG